MIRVSSRGDGIAVARDEQGGGGTLWAAPDGVTFRRFEIPASRWILDAHVLGSGDVLVATTDIPRGGPVIVGRYAAGAEAPVEVRVPASEGLSDASFLDGDRRIALVTSTRAFVSDDDGASFTPLAEWEADAYGFYAASGRVTPDGRVEVLAPTFNTCGSSDLLEDLDLLSARPGARAAVVRPVHAFDGDMPWSVTLTADGGFLSLADRDGACVIRARGAGGVRDLGGRDFCSMRVATNRRFTVAVAGARVLRVSGLSARLLGTVPGAYEVADLAVDGRGRALALLDDGRVVRYAIRAAPTVLFVAEPAAP